VDPKCVFCKIAAKQLPAKLVFENERLVAFEDLNPAAPTHVLLVPREHLASSLDVDERTHGLVGELVSTAARIARERGIADDGFRLVFNTNAAAGQTVFHLHLHLLGGRTLRWPPG
jgi:histidine triad (HIT) family protein